MRGRLLRLPSLALLVPIALLSMGSLAGQTPPPTEDGGDFFVTIVGTGATAVYMLPVTEVPSGSIVRFQNRADVPHSAIADDGSFSTPLFPTGESWEVVVTGSGIVTYHCDKHADTMKAVFHVV